MQIEQVCKYFTEVPDRFYVSDDGTVYRRLKRCSNGRYVITYNGVKIWRKEIPSEIPVVYHNDLVLLEHKCCIHHGYKVLPTSPRPGTTTHHIGLHRIVAHIFNNVDIDTLVVHHLDENKLNNHKSNLVGLPHEEHLRLHGKEHTKEYMESATKAYVEAHKKFASFDYEIGTQKGSWADSLKSFCKHVGVSYRALYMYIQRHPNQSVYVYKNLRIYNIVR